MRAVVTGASGFIGSHLVDRLMAEGHSVVGIDNLSSGAERNLRAARRRSPSAQFSFVKADVQDPAIADIVAEANPDVVLHLAAHVDPRASADEPLRDARNNVLGTINVLEACREAGVLRVVYAASGGSRYGIPGLLPVAESARLAPTSPYAAAKVAGELYVKAYSAMYGLKTITLGLAKVYGPRQDRHGEGGVVAIFGAALLSGTPIIIYGDGTANRDYVYVGDVVDAFVRAAEAPAALTGSFNIGTGIQTTVNELHRLIAAETGSAAPPSYTSARPGEVPAIALDISKAARNLGWTPAVAIGDGIKRTVEWLSHSQARRPLTGLVPGSHL